MYRATLILLCTSLSLTACVHQQALQKSPSQEVNDADFFSGNGCYFIERNLTVEWGKRTYWCVPMQAPAIAQ